MVRWAVLRPPHNETLYALPLGRSSRGNPVIKILIILLEPILANWATKLTSSLQHAHVRHSLLRKTQIALVVGVQAPVLPVLPDAADILHHRCVGLTVQTKLDSQLQLLSHPRRM
jgi:hypothetical protein